MEGIIKFKCENIGVREPNKDDNKIIYWRNFLKKRGFIGVDSSGYGYGNISIRRKNSFLITASQSSGIEKFTWKHIVEVLSWNVNNNELKYIGFNLPSSEAIVHGAAYDANPYVKGVVHIHSIELWERLKDDYPTTPHYAKEGTKELALEVKKIIEIANLPILIVMEGHYGGLLFCGKSLWEAVKCILQVYKTL